MKKLIAKRMLETACVYLVKETLFDPPDFEKEVKQRDFLEQYLRTIYVSGFNNDVVETHFSEIKRRFHDLNLAKIARMRRISAQSLPIKNQRKADAFLKGCKMIHAEGWQSLKKRILRDGKDALKELPFMGSANLQLIALTLGIEDTEKADTWMKKCAERCNAKSVRELVDYLVVEFDMTRAQIDELLWRYCQENKEIPNV